MGDCTKSSLKSVETVVVAFFAACQRLGASLLRAIEYMLSRVDPGEGWARHCQYGGPGAAEEALVRMVLANDAAARFWRRDP
jgi:hypothetical protein